MCTDTQHQRLELVSATASSYNNTKAIIQLTGLIPEYNRNDRIPAYTSRADA